MSTNINARFVCQLHQDIFIANTLIRRLEWQEETRRPIIGIDRINNLIPVLVEDCTKDSESSHCKKMKEFKRLI